MKLIIVLSDDSYSDETAKIFSKAHIPIFSEMDIRGFKTKKKEGADLMNWFASAKYPAYSSMNFAFVNKGQEEELFSEIEDFNKNFPEHAPIHAFVLNVEKFV